MRKSLLILIGAATLACGCSQAPAPTSSGTPAATAATPVATATATPEAAMEVSPEVKAKADELMAARENDKFPYKSLGEKENGPAYVYLAGTSDDPKVVAGALQAIAKVYSADKAYEKTNLADESVDKVIIKSLKSDNPEILYFGFKAAGKALGKEPNQEVIDLLCDHAVNHKQVGARHEALDALTKTDKYDENAQIMDVFVKALKDDAPVASLALFRRRFSWKKGDKAAELEAIVVGLLEHEDPGVRGRAIETYAEFHQGEDAVVMEKVEPMLKDKNPYVRAAAVGSLSRVKDPKAIDMIMMLVDDPEKNTYDIKYENLIGSSERVHHDGSAWSRVNDAALYSLKSNTYRLPEAERFVYDKIDYKTVDADIAAQAEKAKKWHAEFKKKS